MSVADTPVFICYRDEVEACPSLLMAEASLTTGWAFSHSLGGRLKRSRAEEWASVLDAEVFTLTGNLVTVSWQSRGRHVVAVLAVQDERDDARLDEMLSEQARQIGVIAPIQDRVAFANVLMRRRHFDHVRLLQQIRPAWFARRVSRLANIGEPPQI